MLEGQELGPFRIKKELGSGAMGTVYLASYSKKKGLSVAIKVLPPGLAGNDRSKQRFEREAAILKQFNHPNIVKIFAIGKQHGVRYYAMELVHGESMEKTLERRGRLSWEEVVDLGIQLCEALQHAHEKGVIHRDLKPSNLMLQQDGTLKLTDFGIAKDLDVTQLTSANCTVGTASYMSPEQCQGLQDLTAKSDLYSLGIVFYELLTGKKPFEAENAMDMFLAHVSGEFVRPRKIVPEIPKWLDVLICQLLEKKPEQRPYDANKVAETLEEIKHKMEDQRSIGQDLVEKRHGDLERHDRPRSEEDKEAARTIRAGKKRRKRTSSKKKEKEPFYRALWFQFVSIPLFLLALGGLTWLVFFKPPDAEKLFNDAKSVMEENPPNLEHWRYLVSDKGPIAVYRRHYKAPGEDEAGRQKKMDAWRIQILVTLVEHKMTRLVSHRLKKRDVPTYSESEKLALEGSLQIWHGTLDDAEKTWKQIVDRKGTVDYDLMASNVLVEIKNANKIRERTKLVLERAHLEHNFEKFRKGSPTAQLAFSDEVKPEQVPEDVANEVMTLLHYEEYGDILEAQERALRLKKKWAEDLSKRWRWPFILVCWRENALEFQTRNLGQEGTESKAKLRLSFVKEKLDQAKMTTDLTMKQDQLKELILLYEGDEKFKALVDEAKSLLKGE